ncbi:formate dehydrogenase subunit gamma [Marivibrio halodurans]|uniref:Formate dehydrogenase subunit gamma n=2 Tax=Marivibrio halodurans TaxID=2039722 RepID=A0A8J7SKA5_9PROT|nr:formate dehydrogenase subunit gamma [Marivibrio halodurans]
MVGPAVAQEAAAQAQPQPGPEEAVGGTVPGAALGTTSDADFWRQIRRGVSGVSQQTHQAGGRLIQSSGDNWRAVRNGPVSRYGVWLLIGAVALLAVFFALRGRIRIEHGPAGTTIERFAPIERVAHWLTAGSFVILAITGLNLLYGRYVLPPVIGKEAFAAITLAGKWAHNWVAFAFMVGLVMIFVLWVVHNIPSRVDLKWFAQGGGLFSKGVHPPARKFNGGQKIVFWATILGGASLSLSGWALLDPFTTTMFADTFAALNLVGFSLPTDLSPMDEQQLAQIWHTVVALVMIGIILAHIYIGSIGMEGAFAAMGSGQVDLNWAREHHSLWVDEVLEKERDRQHGHAQPAE